MHMDITPYVENLRRDLLAAAEGISDEAHRVAERLGFALDPSARLALMEAISQAAAEITAAMSSGSVDVRLSGRELDFVVDAGAQAATPPAAPPPPPPPPPAADDEGLARITLRLPESVKTKAEEAAAAAGQSLNTWLVNLVRGATRDAAIHVDVDLSSLPFGNDFPFGNNKRGNRRMTGWL
jgi:hypothetical protein